MSEQNIMAGGCVRDEPSILGGGLHLDPPPMPTQLDKTLAERGQRYGDYEYMAAVAQNIKLSMRSGSVWKSLASFEQESLEAIATKIARVVCGELLQRDSWHDIGGYAKLAEDRCPPATP